MKSNIIIKKIFVWTIWLTEKKTQIDIMNNITTHNMYIIPFNTKINRPRPHSAILVVMGKRELEDNA